VLFNATVTAEGAGTVCEEEANINVTEDGIRLNLMRIALINRSKKHQPKTLKDISEEQFKEYTAEGLPKIQLSRYKYALTNLNVGFLYIVNENDEKGWSEWEIGESNELTEITKENQTDKDFRITTSDSITLKQYVAKTNELLYIAYSEVQWSAAYWKKMRTDCEARAERMQLFDASEHVQKKPQPNVIGPVQAQEHTSCIPEDQVGLNFLQNAFSTAQSDAKTKKTDYDIDVVICIHDPIGIAEELISFLDYYWLKMDSLLISMKIGVNQSEVEKALRKNKDPKTLQKKEAVNSST